jgi:hypothetical protein
MFVRRPALVRCSHARLGEFVGRPAADSSLDGAWGEDAMSRPKKSSNPQQEPPTPSAEPQAQPRRSLVFGLVLPVVLGVLANYSTRFVDRAGSSLVIGVQSVWTTAGFRLGIAIGLMALISFLPWRVPAGLVPKRLPASLPLLRRAVGSSLLAAAFVSIATSGYAVIDATAGSEASLLRPAAASVSAPTGGWITSAFVDGDAPGSEALGYAALTIADFPIRTGPWYVNVRSGPSASSPVIGVAPPLTDLAALGWQHGQSMRDMWTGEPDERWYFLGGRDASAAAALMATAPPSAQNLARPQGASPRDAEWNRGVAGGP